MTRPRERRSPVVPIPGTTNASIGREPGGAADIEFTPGDLREIELAADQVVVHGDRYPPELQARVGR